MGSSYIYVSTYVIDVDTANSLGPSKNFFYGLL